MSFMQGLVNAGVDWRLSNTGETQRWKATVDGLHQAPRSAGQSAGLAGCFSGEQRTVAPAWSFRAVCTPGPTKASHGQDPDAARGTVGPPGSFSSAPISSVCARSGTDARPLHSAVDAAGSPLSARSPSRSPSPNLNSTHNWPQLTLRVSETTHARHGTAPTPHVHHHHGVDTGALQLHRRDLSHIRPHPVARRPRIAPARDQGEKGRRRLHRRPRPALLLHPLQGDGDCRRAQGRRGLRRVAAGRSQEWRRRQAAQDHRRPGEDDGVFVPGLPRPRRRPRQAGQGGAVPAQR